MNGARRRSVTIAEVALNAGVSVPTVSRVLNGSAPVADPTRQRVLRSIERLGYHPNPMARGLSRGRSDTVLVVVPHVTEPSVTARLGGLISVLRDTPYELHLVDVQLPVEQRRRSLSQIVAQAHPAAAVIISLPPDTEDTRRLLESPIPVTLVDIEHDQFPADAIDDVAGGMLAVEYLLSLGHTRIAFVGDREETAIGVPASANRRIGYERALANAGIPIRPDYISFAPHGSEAAAAATHELLRLDDPPTAIFAASDVQAFGVLGTARQVGARVPADLSVLGFDDIYAASLVGLSTVRQPLEVSGRRAGLRILASLGHEVEPLPPFPDLEIVDRETTGPVGGTTKSQAGARRAPAVSKRGMTPSLVPAAGREERREGGS